MVGIAYTTLDH